MLKKPIIIITLLLPLALSAQMGKLIGTVLDEATEQPLAGANVWTPKTTHGAACDTTGSFYFPPLSPGTYTVKVSMLGYQTQEVQDVEIVVWKTTRLDIKLKQTVLEGEPVKVKTGPQEE